MIITDGKARSLDIVGSSTYGRDPKIMSSRTFNMITADGWFIDNYGYKKALALKGGHAGAIGRGIFASVRGNILISVVGINIYSIKIYVTVDGTFNYSSTLIGNLTTLSGPVFIDENNTNQIAICDQTALYIYNHMTEVFVQATLPEGFVPGYVTYQDGRFIISDLMSASWALSQVGDGTNWFWGDSGNPVLGAIQTKPDLAQAVLRVPGKGNLLYVFGKTVTELWTDVGSPTFPYQRSSSVNFDYGLLSIATLASSDEIIAWLGQNEKSGPVIMFSQSANVQQLSTDGINYRLSQLNKPQNSSAFFSKISGHLLYQITFYDPSDNYSLIYDFTASKFYDVTDENQDFHIARSVAFLNDDYYFVSFKDTNIYQMDASFTTYDYGTFKDGSPKVYDIPRIRVCSNIRMPTAELFAINNITFTLEQGNDYANSGNPDYQPRIAISVSRNGGISFGSYSTRPVYVRANRINKLNWWGLGSANDFVPQFRFWGTGPWKATNGQIYIK